MNQFDICRWGGARPLVAWSAWRAFLRSLLIATAVSTIAGAQQPRVAAPRLARSIGHIAPGNGVEAMAFSPDGRFAATADGDHKVLVWHVETGAEIRRIDAPCCGSAVQLDLRGDELTVTRDDEVAVW